MWFDNLLESENPGRNELEMFVFDVNAFLNSVLADREGFGFLWEQKPALYELALQTYRSDIAEIAVQELQDAIVEIPEETIRRHGLDGQALRFKFHVINSISTQWERVRGQVSVRAWFRKLVDAIDALLDSLINATGGVGGIIKEFKDALGALA